MPAFISPSPAAPSERWSNQFLGDVRPQVWVDRSIRPPRPAWATEAPAWPALAHLLRGTPNTSSTRATASSHPALRPSSAQRLARSASGSGPTANAERTPLPNIAQETPRSRISTSGARRLGSRSHSAGVQWTSTGREACDPNLLVDAHVQRLATIPPTDNKSERSSRAGAPTSSHKITNGFRLPSGGAKSNTPTSEPSSKPAEDSRWEPYQAIQNALARSCRRRPLPQARREQLP